MKFSINTTSFGALANDLRRLAGTELNKALGNKVAKCVDKVRDDAIALAPIAKSSYKVQIGKKNYKTVYPGRLKKSIKAMMHKPRGDVAGGVYAYYPDGKKPTETQKGDKYYAFAPEYGTTRGGWRETPSRPSPFLRPALLKNENFVMNEISNGIEIAINRAMYGKSRLSAEEVSAVESAMGGFVNWGDVSPRGLKKGKK